jgi:3-isopropylmalate/(R)-2-methylmalate dehydratase small subunit
MPQAIKRFGIDVIVGVSFAEIFAGNSLAIGMPLMTSPEPDIQRLIAHTQANPDTVYTADLEALTVTWEGESLAVEMLEERRRSFLEGTWNIAAILRANLPQVREVAEKLPYMNEFRA